MKVDGRIRDVFFALEKRATNLVLDWLSISLGYRAVPV